MPEAEREEPDELEAEREGTDALEAERQETDVLQACQESVRRQGTMPRTFWWDLPLEPPHLDPSRMARVSRMGEPTHREG